MNDHATVVFAEVSNLDQAPACGFHSNQPESSMTLQARFVAAQATSKALPERPDNMTLLEQNDLLL